MVESDTTHASLWREDDHLQHIQSMLAELEDMLVASVFGFLEELPQ